MVYTLAFNAFKESLSASDACYAAKLAIKKIDKRATIYCTPIADGGDGTMEALVASSGKKVPITVSDPLFRKIKTEYGIIDNGKTAVIEMASASGLALLSENERNPMKTTSLGTGEMIVDAISKGVEKIILGIGGSATTDGGLGVAKALGYTLLDKNGKEVMPTGEGMCTLAKISPPKNKISVKIQVACDVDNPLYGKKGAAFVYAPQKGANASMVKKLDSGLRNLSRVIERDLKKSVSEKKGSGAAGGMGAGLMAFTSATLKSGVKLVLDAANVEEYIKKSDIVFTGEGSVDSQTAYGKAPTGVAKLAKKYNKRCIIIAGSVKDGAENLHKKGVTTIFSIMRAPSSLKEAIANAEDNLTKTTSEVVRLILSS